MPTMQDRRVPLGDQLTAKIVERAGLATPEDKEKVEELRRLAMQNAGNPTTALTMMTSCMAAIFFLSYNNYNRGWNPAWTNEIARIMAEGAWRNRHPQGYSLYGDDGNLGDGGHRTPAQAIAGLDLEVFICLGASKADVGTIDCGWTRRPADWATLAGVADAKRKADLLNQIWAYEKAVGIPNPVHTANVEAVGRQIQEHSAFLARALELGETSLIDTADPLLGERAAARLIGILLRHNWPEPRGVERLEEIQTEDWDDEKHPLAIARKIIESGRPDTTAIRPQSEIGVLIKAMILAESGNSIINPRRAGEIKNAVKNPPDPSYPGIPMITSGPPAE